MAVLSRGSSRRESVGRGEERILLEPAGIAIRSQVETSQRANEPRLGTATASG